MNDKVFDLAKKFIYRNARPIDLVLWKYHFENGSKEDVLNALSAYQNSDGGFAHAIEPDYWNINSTPIATWAAIGKLNQIDFNDRTHPIIVKILEYLDSGKDFADGKWFNAVKSNNDYPHAVWWGCESGEGIASDNPTVSLAGFAIKYADKNSSLYSKASAIVDSAVKQFMQNPTHEMHTLCCYMELYEYCVSEKVDFIDIKAFRTALYDAIRQTICCESEKWATKYVCRPSTFFDNSHLLFDIIDRNICKKEAEILINSQQDDGSFSVTWQWHNDYKEFEIAKNWWKSSIIINNLLFIKALQ
ncbi:MAG: hypothetical protein K2L12_05510 [Clostridia bacterium]|nr:hypothetical protein [Clostridia bacterium]